MLQIYDEQTKQMERFSVSGPRVGVYTCGITPYDTTHLGHAFTYAVSDMLIRYLEWVGYPVTYVQNVTDIDDDILRKAREAGEDWQVLGNRWTAHFIEDMQQLNMRPPDFYPRGTGMIPEIQGNVQKLIENGHAYVRNGSVYFDINTWKSFGELSHLTKEEMLPVANQRGNNPEDPNKRNPLDFVLWQAQTPDEPAWESPWGPGRPGWHIECSTMSVKLLGETVDIHLGGSDLVFPHHECEIAQSEAVTGSSPFVRHWMHVAMVRYGNEKMSKSLGNLVMVSDLLSGSRAYSSNSAYSTDPANSADTAYSGDAIRIYLAMHHYRQAWEYEEEELKEAARLAALVRSAIESGSNADTMDKSNQLPEVFEDAMDNDLNTPGALRVMKNMADQILENPPGSKVVEDRRLLKNMASVLGLSRKSHEPDLEVIAGWARHLEQFRVH